MHVDVVGHGPPLVLLHGWAMHGGVFAPLVERLRDRHTLHVVDLPGHGRSRHTTVPLQIEACTAAIAAMVPVAPWCGWSLGGLVALHAAATRPSQVPALAMLCASPRFVRGEDWPHGVSAEIFHDFATGLRSDYRATLERFVAPHANGVILQLAGQERRNLIRGDPAVDDRRLAGALDLDVRLHPHGAEAADLAHDGVGAAQRLVAGGQHLARALRDRGTIDADTDDEAVSFPDVLPAPARGIPVLFEGGARLEPIAHGCSRRASAGGHHANFRRPQWRGEWRRSAFRQ